MIKFVYSFLVFFVLSIIAPIFLSAATSSTGTVQLEITVPATTRVGEAIDLSVRAVDKDKKTVTGYRGSVMFNTDNFGDTFPASGKAIVFTADDNGEKKFSKGLIFKKSGKQKIYVSDISDDILGEATITVEAATNNTPTTDQSITIITPENGTKVTNDMLMVSGKTRKNSKVSIKINGKAIDPIFSDDTGIFTKNVTGLTQEDNLLVAELLDSSNATLATSQEVRFGRILSSAGAYGVSISPSSTVEISSPITITVDATPKLAELSVTLDNSVLVAKEDTSGKYIVTTVAPSKTGSYDLPITYKDTLGQSKTTDSLATLTVTGKTLEAPTLVAIPSFKNVKTTTKGPKVTFDFSVEDAPTEMTSFKIAYGKNADSLSQEVVTLPLDRINSSTSSGAYTWYIDNLPPDTYTFKIFGRSKDGTLISGLVSEPIIATVGKNSCTIGNVSGLKVDTNTTKSILSWDSLTGATAYNIYKVSPSGDYVLFQNTKEPTYTLFLSKGAVKYENFVIKALCDTSTESKEYSSMSRVQTGPSMIAVIVIVSAVLGGFLMRRRYI